MSAATRHIPIDYVDILHYSTVRLVQYLKSFTLLCFFLEQISFHSLEVTTWLNTFRNNVEIEELSVIELGQDVEDRRGWQGIVDCETERSKFTCKLEGVSLINRRRLLLLLLLLLGSRRV
jgi:hypothetical protein